MSSYLTGSTCACAVWRYALAVNLAPGTQEVTRDETEFVSALRTLLRQRVGAGRYDLWFGESSLTLHGNILSVCAPTQFIANWLQRQFQLELKACLRELSAAGQDAAADSAGIPEAVFLVGQAHDLNAGAKAGPSRQTAGSADLAEDAHSADPAQGSDVSEESAPKSLQVFQSRLTSSDAPCELGSILSGTDIPRQPAKAAPHTPSKPAIGNRAATTGPAVGRPTAANSVPPTIPGTNPAPGTSPRKFASLDDFVVGGSNRSAWNAAELVFSRPGALTPLFIHGPTSVGKTHLLEGIWSKARRAGISAVFLTAEQFVSSYVSALRGGGMPSFRRKHRDVGFLLIDDLHFISGKKKSEEELLFTIDALVHDGRQIVLAADVTPAELEGFGPELQTRLQAGLACPIDRPGLAEREGIVRRFAMQRELALPDDVLHYVASRIETHARELCGAVNRLYAFHLATGRDVDLAAAEEVLGESLRRARPQIQLKEIERAVCQEFQIDAKNLRSPKKTQDVSHPRMLAMFLARKHTRAALSEIGSYFGGRSHSTVVSAQKKVERWIKVQQILAGNASNFTADEAIRRLEERLRVG